MNESFSVLVPLDALLEAVQRFQVNGGDGPQPNLVVEIDDHSQLTIHPEPVRPVTIPSMDQNRSN